MLSRNMSMVAVKQHQLAEESLFTEESSVLINSFENM